eukprot:944-Pyramimonas_sp.AAC.1
MNEQALLTQSITAPLQLHHNAYFVFHFHFHAQAASGSARGRPPRPGSPLPGAAASRDGTPGRATGAAQPV